MSSRLEFLEEFLAKNFVNNNRSNTSGALNRRGIADSPLLRTLLAIPQKSWEPCFWEMMDSFVLVPCACFAALRTLLQKLLGCLSSILDSKVLFCWYKQKKVVSINYGSSKNSWKPWKWVRVDLILSMRDIYINYNLKQVTKPAGSSRSTESKDVLPWNISQMIPQHVKSHKLSDEMMHPVVCLTESQWKLRRQHKQNFQKEESHSRNKY